MYKKLTKLFPLLVIAFLVAAISLVVAQVTRQQAEIDLSSIATLNKNRATPGPTRTPAPDETPIPTYAPVPLDGPTLWSGEAESLSCYPDGLDRITMIDSGTKRYTNHVLGYSFDCPVGWRVDNHAVPYYTRFFDENFRLDVTVEEAGAGARGRYMTNTISAVRRLVVSDKIIRARPYEIRAVEYIRPLIDGIERDMNCYTYYFITHRDFVYTMQLKTNEANFETMKTHMEALLTSFQPEDIQTIDLNEKIQAVDLAHDLTLAHENKTLSIPANSFMMGVYLSESYRIEDLEKSLNQKIGTQMFYKPINLGYDSYTTKLLNLNKLPIVTFLYEEAGKSDNKAVLQNILGGVYDAPLSDWAQNIAQLGASVFIRPGNEMNDYWADWCLGNNFNDPDLYKLAFIHIVNIFKSAGATNAYFVWNPNHKQDPKYNWNDAAMFYPGDAFVDFVGLTYYNYGYGNFKSFDVLYEDYYWEYARAYYKKPLIIGEYGTVEQGGNKAKWIEEMFAIIPEKYPNIKLAVWFDAKHSAGSRYDMRINTSKDSLAAFKEGMNQPPVIKQLINTP